MVYGCFQATMVKSYSWDKGWMAQKAYKIHYLALYQKVYHPLLSSKSKLLLKVTMTLTLSIKVYM